MQLYLQKEKKSLWWFKNGQPILWHYFFTKRWDLCPTSLNQGFSLLTEHSDSHTVLIFTWGCEQLAACAPLFSGPCSGNPATRPGAAEGTSAAVCGKLLPSCASDVSQLLPTSRESSWTRVLQLSPELPCMELCGAQISCLCWLLPTLQIGIANNYCSF